jgi:hypothetical protein
MEDNQQFTTISTVPCPTFLDISQRTQPLGTLNFLCRGMTLRIDVVALGYRQVHQSLCSIVSAQFQAGQSTHST